MLDIQDTLRDKENITTGKKKRKRMLFEGLCFLFVTGKNMSKAREKILKSKVVEKGGDIVDKLTDETTHIVTGTSYKSLLKKLQITELNSNIKVYNPGWVSESLQAGELLMDGIFEVSREEEFSQVEDTKKDEEELDRIMEDQQLNQGKRKKQRKDYFACQQGVDEIKENINKDITDELEKLEKIYEQTGDHFRALAYRRAVSAIRRYPKKITSEEEAKKIKGVGAKTAEKIGEFLKYGHLSKLESLENDESTKIVQLFTQVWGVGPKTAKEWYSQGFRTLEDLKSKASLTKAQEIGLKYFHEFKQRIPRAEVAQIEALVKREAEKVKSGLTIITCGSYRRGSADSGDVDILITDPSVVYPEGLLSKIVERLKKIKFLTDDLSQSRKNEEGERDTYMGVCKLPGSQYHRRIDLKVYPKEQYCFALLYFTGSDYFNRSMRLYAHKRGLSLSDKALRPVIRISKQKVYEGEPIPCTTEKDIFDALKLDYKEPHERNL